MIVGLAGHIDHGKTALVKALTGVAGDRLKDEKARGITIDLGFAYMPTRSGLPIGFIDVPGHERFVHTMLAGASGVDFALLTIAVDDGIMPQTLEHLAILDLLGIDRGAVVLTKTDLAPPEFIENVARQAKAMIAATALARAEVMAVSSLTGAGVDALRAHLEEASVAVRDRAAGKRFRLAVDRVFTLSGVGVVATGTVLSGSVHLGDRIQLSPSGLFARVRSLHAQNRPAEVAHAGERCALNLTGPGITKRCDSTRRRGARSRIVRANRSHRRPRPCSADREKADWSMVPCPTSSCLGGSRRAHRPVRRRADRARRRGQRPARP